MSGKVGHSERLRRGLENHSARRLLRQVLAESLGQEPPLLEDLLLRVPKTDLRFLSAEIDRKMLHGWSPHASQAHLSVSLRDDLLSPRARGGQPLHPIVGAPIKLDAAILGTQAKKALVGLGWKAAIAQAASAAASAALGTCATFEQLIFEALRRCPKATS